MKTYLITLNTFALATLLPLISHAQQSINVDNDQLSTTTSAVQSAEQPIAVSDIDMPPITINNEQIELEPNAPKEALPEEEAEVEMSPWSASAFYLYNATTEKMLLVPSPGYEMGGFKANAQSASYTPEKFYDFEAKASTNWTIGQDADKESKLLFMANASIKRRLVVAVPFIEVSKGLSFKSDYSQVSMGASTFIPTPWFFILPKYTATYSNANMNEFSYGVSEGGWSSGWGVTLLKPINKNWTFLAIYSAKKLEEDLRIKSDVDESNQSLMMILSYQFDKK